MKFFAAPAERAGLGAVVLVAASRCPLFSFFALLVLLLFQPHHQLAASHVAVNQQVSLVPDAAAAKAAGVGVKLAAAKNRLTAADALLPRRCLAPLAGRHVAGWGRT
ncbi:hypothetical protein OsI_35127 [Oryza sativa Indica Group]|uniref:Uncharacterized protein n=1 Tax=Oryza sativa subsp. indica TaxID=39946 RepID=A2ZBH9_ORYSI|nr:hypothetical protein OsI_35127 [Oryza sativa Indica Group]